MTALYRHFDAAGTLLYVGITNSPTARWRNHMFKSTWTENVVRIEIEWFPTRQEALAAEWRAITVENPVYNQRRRSSHTTAHRPSRRPEIVTMFREGRSVREIAETLDMSTQGVYDHLKREGFTAPFAPWKRQATA